MNIKLIIQYTYSSLATPFNQWYSCFPEEKDLSCKIHTTVYILVNGFFRCLYNTDFFKTKIFWKILQHSIRINMCSQQTPAVTRESYLPCHALNADSKEEVAGVQGDWGPERLPQEGDLSTALHGVTVRLEVTHTVNKSRQHWNTADTGYNDTLS